MSSGYLSVADVTKQILGFFSIASDLHSFSHYLYDKDKNIKKLPLSLDVVILTLALNTRALAVLQKRRERQILSLHNDFIILNKL